MRIFLRFLLLGTIIAASMLCHIQAAAFQQQPDDHNDSAPTRVGFVIVTPTCVAPFGSTCTGTPSGMVVFETFGLKRGDETTQAGIIPSGLTTRALLFVNTSPSLSRDIGLAIANPGNTAANVTLGLTDQNGESVGTKSITVSARQQTPQFVTQLFSALPSATNNLTGVLTLSSDVPVAAVGLRFRGANFSTLPLTNLSPSASVPQIATRIGGPGAVVLPQYAIDGGWSSEIVIMNTGSQLLQANLAAFKPDGSRFSLKERGIQTEDVFIIIQPGQVATFAPRDSNGNSRF